MRLKTLGVVLIGAMAAFTMLYWYTDGSRRAAVAVEQEEELLHFGEIVFADDPSAPESAGCARCHGTDGEGGEIPNDPEGRTAPSLRTASLANKLNVNGNYVELVVTHGGVVVSGNVNSLMPAWGIEAGGPLTRQQVEAVSTLVEGWAEEAGAEAPEDVEDTVEAGREVFLANCATCHGQELEGSISGPDISTIGSELVTEFGDFPTPSGLDQMVADYDEDPRNFLELWIRDSSGNYNDGEATGMQPFPESDLSESQLTALITYLLDQTGE